MNILINHYFGIRGDAGLWVEKFCTIASVELGARMVSHRIRTLYSMKRHRWHYRVARAYFLHVSVI